MGHETDVDLLEEYIQLLDILMPQIFRYRKCQWDGLLGCEAQYIGPGPDDHEVLRIIGGPHCDRLLDLETKISNVVHGMSSELESLFCETSMLTERHAIVRQVRDRLAALDDLTHNEESD